MNILAPVRRDRVLAELPQVGAKATSGSRLWWVWAGRGGTRSVRDLGPALPPC